MADYLLKIIAKVHFFRHKKIELQLKQITLQNIDEAGVYWKQTSINY